MNLLTKEKINKWIPWWCWPKYEGPTKDIVFNEYYDSQELYNGVKSINIKFDDAVKIKKRS